ncbi:MAG: hypothetical protein ACYDBQ_06185 [Thermoplasmatota archaeon]
MAAAKGRKTPVRGEAYVAPKYRGLLDDENVARWHRRNSKKSLHTGEEYVRVLGRALGAMGLTPAGLVSLGRRAAEDRVHDYADSCLAAGRSRNTVRYHADVLASWLKWNDMPMTRPYQLPAPTYREEMRKKRVPTRDDLRRTLAFATPRDRLIITAIAYSGMRPRVLADQSQQDGLRFGDLPEARLQDGQIEFDAVPTLVNVRASLSKNHKPYRTFFTREQCDTLAACVEERSQAGQELTPESFVIAPVKNSPSGVLSRSSLFKAAKIAMRKAGLGDVQPYAWKNYCADRMRMGEHDRDNLWTRESRMFVLGHGGSDIAMLYAMRQEMPLDTLEKLRETFGVMAARHLEANAPTPAENPRTAVYEALLQVAGHTPEEVKEMDVATKSPQELLELARKAFVKPVPAMSAPASGGRADLPGKPTQRILQPEELAGALAEGWSVRMEMRDGRILVESPTAR